MMSLNSRQSCCTRRCPGQQSRSSARICTLLGHSQWSAYLVTQHQREQLLNQGHPLRDKELITSCLTVTQVQIKATHVSAYIQPQTSQSHFNAQAN